MARGKYALKQIGLMAEDCGLLVIGYVAGGTAVTTARRNFPEMQLHDHRLATAPWPRP